MLAILGAEAEERVEREDRESSLSGRGVFVVQGGRDRRGLGEG